MVGLVKYVSMLDDLQIKMYVSQTWVITVVNKQQIPSVKSLALNLLKKTDSSQKANAKVKIQDANAHTLFGAVLQNTK